MADLTTRTFEGGALRWCPYPSTQYALGSVDVYRDDHFEGRLVLYTSGGWRWHDIGYNLTAHAMHAADEWALELMGIGGPI